MKKLCTILLFCLLGTFAYGQQVKVSGVVTDANDGQPVIGATVVLGGTTKAVLTDVDGRFEITAKDGQAIEFRYVGFYTETILANAKSPQVNISLRPEAVSAQDVVVVGYGVQRKRDVTGAIASIKADDVKAGVLTSTAQMLQGRAAGVQVRTNSSEPGGGITIRVRGASSISSNNDPLYVIDGFQTDLGNTVNPADIESMEVLKDAAATAIYGARGANGVIIITTKKGRAGHFSVDYSYNASIKTLHNPWDLMNAQDIMGFAMRTWEENGKQGNAPYTDDKLAYKGNGTDWIAEATRTSWTQLHQVNVSGGTEKLQMNISAGYTDDKGILLNTDFSRFSTRLNLDYKLSNRVRFGSNMYLARTQRSFQPMGTNATTNNVLYTLFHMSPMSGTEDVDIFGDPQRKPQTIKMLTDVDIENISTDVYASIFAEADILKNLTARVQYTYGTGNGKYRSYYPRTTNVGSAVDGLATIENDRYDKSQVDALLTYNNTWNKIHFFQIMGGFTYMSNMYTYDAMSGQGFSTDEFSFNNMGAAKEKNYLSSSQSLRSSMSYFARAEYILKDKYVFRVSMRADGSSNFGKDNKWGYFPSGSFAWQLGDEPWMAVTKPVLSSFKIRTSYGVTGNDGIGSYLSLRKYGTTNSYIGGTGPVVGLYPSNPANPDLRWESTSQFNIGADITLANRRVEISFDYYYKVTKDLLNRVSVSNSTGGFTTMMQNNGSVENKGWELFIKSYNIVKPNFSWSTTLNLSQNKNKVLEYNGGAPTYLTVSPQGWYNHEEYSVLREGISMSTLYGYKFAGIKQIGQNTPTQPKSVDGDPLFEDTNGDGIITPDDRVFLGNGTPDIVFGLGNTFNFYNFDVTLFIDGAFGHEMFNLTRMILEDDGRLRASMDKWTLKHASNAVPRNGYRKDSGLQYGSFVNDRFVENASYLRIQNIEVGYSIPFKNWEKVYRYIKNLRVFVGVQNLHTFTEYTGFTPDVSVNGGNAIAQGLDYNTYPAYTMFNFGAKITF